MLSSCAELSRRGEGRGAKAPGRDRKGQPGVLSGARKRPVKVELESEARVAAGAAQGAEGPRCEGQQSCGATGGPRRLSAGEPPGGASRTSSALAAARWLSRVGGGRKRGPRVTAHCPRASRSALTREQAETRRAEPQARPLGPGSSWVTTLSRATASGRGRQPGLPETPRPGRAVPPPECRDRGPEDVRPRLHAPPGPSGAAGPEPRCPSLLCP